MSDDPTSGAPAPTRWISLAGTCTAAGLVWLAFADLGVAIPTIADELHADLSALQWANNAFSLVTGALVIAAGRFGDVFGRRRMLLIGVALFAGFSVVGATASDVSTLVIGRGLMGVGAALILPATLAVIPPQFSGKAQLTAFGVWQAVAWGGQAIGPAIGGIITDGPGWPWLFWINIPLGVVAYLVITRFTPESSDADASSAVDWPGLITIGLAVFALLYALTDGPTRGWGDPFIVGLLILAVVLAVSWVVIEKRVGEPLVDLRLFTIRSYDGALTANLTMNVAFAGISYILVLWLQNARGYSAVEAGMLMLPSTLGIFAFIPLGGRMAQRRGSRLPVLIGLLVMSVGLLVIGQLTVDSTLLLLGVGLVVVGLGLGLLSTPISNTAVGEAPPELAGTAAGVFKMSSMVGGALGVAVLTAIARSATEGDVDTAAAAAGMSSGEIDQAHRALVQSASFSDALTRLPADLAQKVTDAAVHAFTDGVTHSMVATGVLAVVATAVVALLWPSHDQPDPPSDPT
jgi:EmrB/QacA subfamily drug resistance transporter